MSKPKKASRAGRSPAKDATKESRGFRSSPWAFVALAVVVVVAIGWQIWAGVAGGDDNRPTVNSQMHGAEAGAAPKPADEIVVPRLTSAAQMGKLAFDQNCAACHGENAAGTDNGPPFIHKIYEPSHHADFAWFRAVRNGVRAHHWRHGDMQPVEGVSDKQIEWIVTYVREMQRANGIQ